MEKHARTWELPSGDRVTLSVYDKEELKTKLKEPEPTGASRHYYWEPDSLQFLIVLAVNSRDYMYDRANPQIANPEEAFKEYEAFGPLRLIRLAMYRIQSSGAPAISALADLTNLTHILLDNETPEGLESIILNEKERMSIRFAALKRAHVPATTAEKLAKLIDTNPGPYSEHKDMALYNPDAYPKPVREAILRNHVPAIIEVCQLASTYLGNAESDVGNVRIAKGLLDKAIKKALANG